MPGDDRKGSGGTQLEFGSADAHATTGASNPAVPAAGPATPAKIGRFEVESRLGEGGMGAVLLATDPVLGRRVAIKILHATADNTDAARRRLLREAQGTARLVHENVIVVHEVGTFDDQVYVAMEYVAGGTLRAWQRNRPWQAIVAMYARAGRGLQAAHDAGLVHRDFKPDNVLVGDDDRVRVTDFGLVAAVDAAPDARVEAPSLELASKLTQTGAIMGTPRYMAPEQHRGEAVDARGDQFAFCAALYEALYHQPPFAGDTYADLARSVVGGELRAEPDTSVPVHVRDAVRRGLRRDRDERFPAMRDLLAALAATDTVIARPRRWPTVVAAVGALAVGGAIYLAVRASGSPPAGPAPRDAAATAPVRPDAAVAPDPTATAQLKEVQAAFDEAQLDYLQGDFAKAATGFERAYVLRPFPQFLYNAAASYHELGGRTNEAATLRKAGALYRRYLAEAPQAPDRVAVEATITKLAAAAQRLDSTPAASRTSLTSGDLRPPEGVSGLLVIDSVPPDAEIWVDEMKQPLGRTPWSGFLTGSHTIRLDKAGYQRTHLSIDVAPNKLLVLRTELSPDAR